MQKNADKNAFAPHLFAPSGAVWLSDPPCSPGAWWMICAESEGEPELVQVAIHDGELWAIDCDVGSLTVARYHDGLTNCLWQQADKVSAKGAK